MKTITIQQENICDYSYDEINFKSKNESRLIRNNRAYSNKFPFKVNISKTNKLFQIPLMHNFVNITSFKKHGRVSRYVLAK